MEGIDFTVFRADLYTPDEIVVYAIGLAGDESQPYIQKCLNSTNTMVITVRGLETSFSTSHETQLFKKNDTARLTRVLKWVRHTFPFSRIRGIGMSLGGALMIQTIAKDNSLVDSLTVCSTSIHYKHAIETLAHTWFGMLVNRVLVWWQFWCLWKQRNYLQNRLTMHEWFCLFKSKNMLEFDRVLCKHYGLDYDSYISELDLRSRIKHIKVPFTFILSEKDEMFSTEHMEMTKQYLSQCKNVEFVLTKGGGHGRID